MDPILEIEIQDNTGKIIMKEKVQESLMHTVSIANNVAGLYLLKIKTTTGLYVEKVEKR